MAPDLQDLLNAGGAHIFEEIENVIPAEVAAPAATGKTHLVGWKVIFE